jgi:hypothetical protein
VVGAALIAEEPVPGAGIGPSFVGLAEPPHRLLQTPYLVERDQVILVAPEGQDRRLNAVEEIEVAGPRLAPP